MVEPAICRLIWELTASLKCKRPIAITRWASSLDTIRGQIKEFHWLIKVRMPMVAMAFLLFKM